MTTIESICEQALGHLGIGDTITNVSTDQTAIAKAFRRFYQPTLDELQETVPWAWAKRYFDFTAQAGSGTVTVAANVGTFTVSQDKTLNVGDTITINDVEYVIGARTSGLVWATSGANVTAQAFTIAKGVTANPTLDWGYAYRVPSKVLAVRRLVDGNRTPIRTNWPVFWMGSDATGKLLYTDETTPVIEYTESITDPTQYPPNFVAALAALLAFKVAPLLTGGDPNRLGLRALQVAQGYILEATASDANQNQPDDDAAPDTIQFRNGGGSIPNRYFR
jgi:hypothetical protein